MGLLDIPPEVLDLIIDASAPDGLESLVLTCKTIYARANTQITRHNALKKRWTYATNASLARRGDTLSLLNEIAREPIIAEYIQGLSLWDRRTADEVQSAEGAYEFRSDEVAMERIKSLIARSELYIRAKSDDWWDQILQEDAAADEENVDKLYATVALLSLLPNLKTFQPPDRWHEVRENEAAEALVPAVESLVSISNNSKRKPSPLGSLETIFPFVEEGYDIRVGLQCLQPFMSLKNLRNLYAVSCVAVEDDWGDVPFHWPDHSLKSHLTRIELASCCMDAGGLAILLQHTPALTAFRYSHQTKWDGLEYDWNPGMFLETLANYCGERLTDLALTVDELHGEIVNGASSFMRFVRLERLEVDVLPFCGPPLESGQRLGRDARIPKGARPWSHVDIPCMGDMLPASMRELQVNTDHPAPSKQALLALFKNIKDRREDKLLQLEKVVVRQYRSSTAQQLAYDHNMILEVFEQGKENPLPRSMNPQWKREFDSRVGGIVMTSQHQ